MTTAILLTLAFALVSGFCLLLVVCQTARHADEDADREMGEAIDRIFERWTKENTP